MRVSTTLPYIIVCLIVLLVLLYDLRVPTNLFYGLVWAIGLLYLLYAIIDIIADRARDKADTKTKRHVIYIFIFLYMFFFLLIIINALSDMSGTTRLGISSYFGSCSAPTVRTYQGKLASYRIAIIETTKESLPVDVFKRVTKVQKVDGEEIRPDTCKIKLLPGEHQLVCSTEVGERVNPLFFLLLIRESIPQTLTIQAEAGHVYKIYGGWDSTHTSMWIVDELTGAVVAGNKE